MAVLGKYLENNVC